MASSLLWSLLPLLLFSPLPATSSKCDRRDEKALLAMKASWGNPAFLSSWDPSTPCCDWPHVMCNSAMNRVIKLYLIAEPGDADGLAGAIPPSVGDLKLLQGLTVMNHPKLVGPIPSSLTRLPTLLDVHLINNSLSGSIPDFLTAIASLESLRLSGNAFTGPVPAKLARLPHLETLLLDRNRLTGPVPDSFGYGFAMPSLHLDLSHNRLAGRLPRGLRAADFSTINLSGNMLSGDASSLFQRWNMPANSGMPTIDISRNTFEFDLSNVKFPTTTYSLDLSHNKIYGRIPEQVAKLGKLQQLDVSYNRLCGRIPTGGNMGKFDKNSYARNLCLCGTPLPPCN